MGNNPRKEIPKINRNSNLVSESNTNRVSESNKPLETNKISYFKVDRVLTKNEWDELTKWREQNKDISWSAWDENPIFKDLVFIQYRKEHYNGEYWAPPAVLESAYQANVEYYPKYRLRRCEKIRETARAYEKLRRENDPVFKLRKNIRNAISQGLRKRGFRKNEKTEEIYPPICLFPYDLTRDCNPKIVAASVLCVKSNPDRRALFLSRDRAWLES